VFVLTSESLRITRTPTLSKEDNLLLFINYSGFIKMDVLLMQFNHPCFCHLKHDFAR
jgi:hypothetical protein